MRRQGLEPCVRGLRDHCCTRLAYGARKKAVPGARKVGSFCFGGIDETRTRTFLIDNQAHSLCASIPKMEGRSAGLEPAWTAFTVQRSALEPRPTWRGRDGGARTRKPRRALD